MISGVPYSGFSSPATWDLYHSLICSSVNDVEAQTTAKVKAWTKKVNNVMKPNVKLNLLRR